MFDYYFSDNKRIQSRAIALDFDAKTQHNVFGWDRACGQLFGSAKAAR